MGGQFTREARKMSTSDQGARSAPPHRRRGAKRSGCPLTRPRGARSIRGMTARAQNRYLLEIGSIVVAVFKEAEGLSSEREIIEIEEGGREEAVKKLGPYAQ